MRQDFCRPFHTRFSQTLTDMQAVCLDIDDPDWQPLENNVKLKPSENTVFVVVDARNKKGAIFVHESESNEYVGGFGIDELGNVVIIPWDHGWFYYTTGCLRVGYMVKLED
ncbi:hypothetical protein PAAG_00538 [Paracoccidioides lutzii Pb01]|uniref:Uncharacterized protein n=1 Tax=Paracoccidioides lutzii (strain ATCC MYA-826 / Pb01) TaxID=502779 RepID=C1GPU3_PARBA|nr:hypothetical protein PAAG_00538 [Paracoccidioides lutzii Pb01]EEH36215.2 hypothetical protein PAAG_00538 [Paracoccidioides lutzii Pb01]